MPPDSEATARFRDLLVAQRRLRFRNDRASEKARMLALSEPELIAELQSIWQEHVPKALEEMAAWPEAMAATGAHLAFVQTTPNGITAAGLLVKFTSVGSDTHHLLSASALATEGGVLLFSISGSAAQKRQSILNLSAKVIVGEVLDFLEDVAPNPA